MINHQELIESTMLMQGDKLINLNSKGIQTVCYMTDINKEFVSILSSSVLMYRTLSAIHTNLTQLQMALEHQGMEKGLMHDNASMQLRVIESVLAAATEGSISTDYFKGDWNVR